VEHGTTVVEVLVMVVWLVVPFAGVELVEIVELVMGDTMLDVVPLTGTLELEVVSGREEVLVHPPEQLVIVFVFVV